MYDIKRKIVYTTYRLFNIRLSSYPYVSGDTFRAFADLKIDSIYDLRKVRIIRDGMIIFCATDVLDAFVEKVLPQITGKFILITHNSDYTVNEKYLSLVNHRSLFHWFAQNSMLSHEKITAIPIGLENRFYHNNGKLSNFNRLTGFGRGQNKRILCSFSVHTKPSIRQVALEALRSSGFADITRVDTSRYLELLSDYAFVASPEGNGVDCHRTWEALYLGVIPIVTGSDFYSQFPNFPGLVFNQWEDLLRYDMASLLEAHLTCRQRLVHADFIWAPYWQNRINSVHNMLVSGQ
jgi:hypothetical protein